MTTETQRALAVVFRRFKETPVVRDDLVKTMSLELSWTKPSKAENLLDRGLNAGYLEEQDGELAPTFDPADVEVPFGFDPSDELFEPVETAASEGAEGSEDVPQEGPEGPLDVLLDRLAEVLEGDRNEAVAAANAQQDELGGLVTLETAALLTAYKNGLDVKAEAGEVLDGLKASA